MTAELGDDPDAFPDFLLTRTPLGRGGRADELDAAVEATAAALLRW